MGTDESPDRVVNGIDALDLPIFRLVSAYRRFQVEMRFLGFQHARGHQSSAGVIEVHNMLYPGRFIPGTIDIDQRRVSLGSDQRNLLKLREKSREIEEC